MEKEFAGLARDLMRDDVDVARLNEARIYRRGFFAGIKFLLDCPTLEAKKLDRALNKENDAGPV
jgi:hypothetical protein